MYCMRFWCKMAHWSTYTRDWTFALQMAAINRFHRLLSISDWFQVRSVSRICARSSIVYVTYTIDKCAHMHETEGTFREAHMRIFVYNSCHVYCNKMRAYALYRIQLSFVVVILQYTRWAILRDPPKFLRR